jgi:hypothetical protein
MHVHTVGEYEQEEGIRNKGDNAKDQRNMDISLRKTSNGSCEVVVPQTIREGRHFRQEMGLTIKDKEFQLRGVLKESFSQIIQKYPTISGGSALNAP